MRSSKMPEIVLYSILTLFFFQLIADFIEATYAFGLMGLGMPVEAVSVLLLLSPVVLLLVPRGLSGWPLVLLGELMLACRVVEPLLGTKNRMLVAGLGVACFLILLPVLITRRDGERFKARGLSLGIGLTVGLSLSILFRALNSGSDLSTWGWFQAIGWILALTAGVLMLGFLQRGDASATAAPLVEADAGARRDQPGFWRTAGLAVGTLGVLALLYFSFSSPSVIARWTSVSHLLVLSIVVVILSLFAIVLVSASRLLAALKPPVILIWNILFVLSMVLTILAHQVSFPSDPNAYPVWEAQVTPLHYVPLVLMLVLFPVVLVDFMLFTQDLADRRPSTRRLGGAFALAGLFLLLMILAQIFTTTFGYVPVVGPPFRDKFWLVYLVAGVAVTLPLLLVQRSSYNLARASSQLEIGPAFPGLIVLVGLVTVLGALLIAAKPVAPSGPTTSLKVLTYNIQQGYNGEGVKNYDGQLALLRQIDADVIGLQECDTNRAAGGNGDVVRYFADRLDMYSYYGPKPVVGTFGVALLSKYPIENPRTFLMHGFTEQKGSIEAQIAVGDRTFNVVVTHLASHEKDPPGNYPQQEEILSVVAGKENVLLIGDFNFGPDTEHYKLTTETLDDSWVLRWPDVDKRTVDFKGEGIDHIFVSPGTRVTDAQYLPDRESDHPATIAVIEW
jgi:endonuclease/exonuclease/phosphatase family metal-dependent hydrolase